MENIMINKVMHVIQYNDLMYVQTNSNRIYIVGRFSLKSKHTCTSSLFEPNGVYILDTPVHAHTIIKCAMLVINPHACYAISICIDQLRDR